MIRLALYGLTGAGKSTVAAQLVRTLADDWGVPASIIKIAAPMRRVQDVLYEMMGRPLQPGQSDQILLRAVADQFRRIDPTFLARSLVTQAAAGLDAVVINDDLRDIGRDYEVLAAGGFQFAHVMCAQEARLARLRLRPDLGQQVESAVDWRHDSISPEWTIDNSRDGADNLKDQLAPLAKELVSRLA